jgi:hypothetical protein
MCLGVVSRATEPRNFQDLVHSNRQVNIGYWFDSNGTTKMWRGVVTCLYNETAVLVDNCAWGSYLALQAVLIFET